MKTILKELDMSKKYISPHADFEESIKIIQKNNVSVLYKAILDEEEWVMKKIKNFCKKYSLEYNSVLIEAKRGSPLIAFLSKDATKQSSHQSIAFDFLKNLPEVERIQQCPETGPNAIYLYDKEIYKRPDLPQSALDKIKSIDFYFEYTYKNSSLKFYCSHKYTTGHLGGSQDNQYHDIAQFMSNAQGHDLKDTVFFAIVDGPYYKKKYNTKTSENITYKNKIEYLNQKYSLSGSVLAVTCDNIEQNILKNILFWLEQFPDSCDKQQELLKIKYLLNCEKM